MIDDTVAAVTTRNIMTIPTMTITIRGREGRQRHRTDKTESDRQTDRQNDRQTDRQTDKHTDRQIDR